MFHLEFETGNAAFDGDARRTEIAAILRGIWRAVKDGCQRGNVYDSNGNHIGHWSIDSDD